MTGISNFSKRLFILTVLLGLNTLLNFGQFTGYPQMKFMVFSDPHFYSPSLGTEGKAIYDYLENDRKLLMDSPELLETVISAIEKSDADFVLIPGDLTKDGETINHKAFSEFLARIENSGKQVFVIPGNHDINNPHSFRYTGDSKERVPSVSPEEFADIYKAYGYGDALQRDKNSLSYVSEPLKDFWLLALDASRYKENPTDGEPITAGKFNKETIVWIEKVLEDARSQNKSVMVMMHHGVVEHYEKQKKLYGEYVVDGYKKISKILAQQGVRLVFTGHFHSQDITMKKFRGGDYILDIETGSLVTYPCPYRSVSISGDQNLQVKSSFITSIPSRPVYAEYSRNYNHSGIAKIAARTLIKMGVDSVDSWSLSGQIADAFLAHYAGDEASTGKPLNMEGVGFKGKFLIAFKKKLVKSLHQDLYPADNNLEIKLK